MMKENYKRIIANEMLDYENRGVIKRGVLNVSPSLFFLLKDDEVKDIVMEQLEIVDELKAGKKVEVYKEDDCLGYAEVVQYPIEGAEGFATVVFDDGVPMETVYMVRVENLIALSF
ncbi:MAG TPA: hypothetical protein VI757_10200 [Bacteroidia bacterium]|nr:hypothetical protein [Bacteroidia bacterium]